MSDEREVEAKFEATDAALECLLRLEHFGTFSLVERSTRQQHDLYFDTFDGRLAEESASLRVRRLHACAELTFKGERQSIGAGSTVSRLEDTAEIGMEAAAQLSDLAALHIADEPLPLRRARAVAAGRDLVPVARLETERTMLLYESGEGAQVEVVLDHCRATRLGDGRETEFSEVEAELIEGEPQALEAGLAELIRAVPGLRPSHHTKLERALG